jgi:hypothetical protein
MSPSRMLDAGGLALHGSPPSKSGADPQLGRHHGQAALTARVLPVAPAPRTIVPQLTLCTAASYEARGLVT